MGPDRQDPWAAYGTLIQRPDATTWLLLAGYFVFEFAVMALVPGGRFEGPLTPMGNRPVYTANGLQCFAVNLAVYGLLYAAGAISAVWVYEQMGKIYTALVVVGFTVCLLLWIKGHRAPSCVCAPSA